MIFGCEKKTEPLIVCFSLILVVSSDTFEWSIMTRKYDKSGRCLIFTSCYIQFMFHLIVFKRNNNKLPLTELKLGKNYSNLKHFLVVFKNCILLKN